MKTKDGKEIEVTLQGRRFVPMDGVESMSEREMIERLVGREVVPVKLTKPVEPLPGIARELMSIDGQRGDQRLYSVVPKLEGHMFVIVSRVNVPVTGWETYVFPANERGEVTRWTELHCSQRGDVSHEQVLIDAGYEIAEPFDGD